MIECPVNHPALPALFDPMIPDHPALWAVFKGRHTGRAVVDDVEHPTQCVLRTDAAQWFWWLWMKSTIIGFEAFRQLAEKTWMSDAFKATDFAIRDLRLTFSESGTVAWYSCYLDDHGEWNGQPGGWDNVARDRNSTRETS